GRLDLPDESLERVLVGVEGGDAEVLGHWVSLVGCGRSVSAGRRRVDAAGEGRLARSGLSCSPPTGAGGLDTEERAWAGSSAGVGARLPAATAIPVSGDARAARVGIDLALGTAEETTVMPRDARAVLHRLRRERGRGSVAAIDQLAGLAEASRALAVHLAGEKEGLRADRLAA